VACFFAAVAVPAVARADNCQLLRYTFQPDCYRAADSATCVQTVEKLDLGPQIAVWLETADGQYVNPPLMVTNGVAARGLGNRPGEWQFLSSPKFPYGKRPMALPIWAHANNHLYPQIVMQDGMEDWLGWHENQSSEDPYYCRPVRASEINVDAITCPTRFNSAKGRFDATLPMVYYPPRNDLTMFTSKDCDQLFSAEPCQRDAEMYASMNDLDAVAAATPPYGRPYIGMWAVPPTLAQGDYALMVEVNKEYDGNDAHKHPAFEDPRLVGYGINNNFGQPSVVWRVPLRFDLTAAKTTSVSAIYGYGAWNGTWDPGTPDVTRETHAPDQTITTGAPGSGEGRLLEFIAPGASAPGRIHVSVEQCNGLGSDGGDGASGGTDGSGGGLAGDGGAVACPGGGGDLPPVAGLAIDATALSATTARVVFRGADATLSAPSYEVRYRAGSSMTDCDFRDQSIRAPQVTLDGGGTASVVLPDLKPSTVYAVGVRYERLEGGPRQSQLAWTTFETPGPRFTQLSGCFIATAAYGSPLAPAVDAMRQVRDDLARRSPLFAAAADIYYRSGPAAAQVLKKSDTARAVVRRLLDPAARLSEVVGGSRKRALTFGSGSL